METTEQLKQIKADAEARLARATADMDSSAYKQGGWMKTETDRIIADTIETLELVDNALQSNYDDGEA